MRRIITALMILPGPAAATLPVNPERPLTATTCEGARERLVEAERGSPLISKAQNARVVDMARAEADRLCGSRGRP